MNRLSSDNSHYMASLIFPQNAERCYKNLRQTAFSIFVAALKIQNLGVILHVNCLLADDLRDIPSLIFPQNEERSYKNLQQTAFSNFIAALKIIIRLDITFESSVIRRLTRHAKPCFPKIEGDCYKFVICCSHGWCFNHMHAG